MRLPCCSISLWSDLMSKTSLPSGVRQSGTRPSPQQQRNLPPHTVNLRPVFEIEDEAVAHNFGEQMEEICLADSGGPGLGICQAIFFGASVNKNDIRVMKSSAFLQMLVVVIDPELKVA